MKAQTYKLAKHPKDHKWYIVGYCGDSYYMQISGPYANKTSAIKGLRHQQLADIDAKNCVQGI